MARTRRPQRSSLERLIRAGLRIQDADPQALLDLRGSLVISATRCVLTYALIPAMVPLIGLAGVVATPLSLALGIAAVLLAVRSLRRVWLADWAYRWAYTAFIAVVLGLLALTIVLDVRALLAA